MIREIYNRIFNSLCRHPRALAVALVCIVTFAAVGLIRVPFESSLEVMLPDNSEAKETVIFLREAEFADKVAVTVNAPDSVESADLVMVMDDLAARFDNLPLVMHVVEFPDGGAMMDDMLFFLENFGEIANREDIAALEKRLDEDEIRRNIRRVYTRLLRPEGAYVQEFVRRDPLNISSIVLQRIHMLFRSFGYQTILQNGRLLHADGKSGLLLLSTSAPLTDTRAARSLLESIEEVCAALPEGYSAQVMSGHSHSVSNEDQLQRDIRLTATAATIGFLLLFLLVFRDPRAVLIFFVPAVSIVISLNFTSLIVGQLSYMVIGFGAVMAGIGVDYSIHSYVAIRNSRERLPAVINIIRPVFLGGATTISVFIAFFASRIPGYKQLAIFGVVSIALSIVSALLLLPPFVKPMEKPLNLLSKIASRGKEVSTIIAPIFWVSIIIAGFLAVGISLSTEITELDGTEEQILEAEKQFREKWSGTDRIFAMAVAPGATYNEAAEINDKLFDRISPEMPEGEFVNFSAIWPSPAKRARNLERWGDFWTNERIERTRNTINEAAAEYGFSEGAFAPFFESLESDGVVADRPEGNDIFVQVEERFVREHNDGIWFISYFPDTEDSIDLVARHTDDMPGTFIASPRGLGRALSESISSEVKLISAIALILILVVSFALMRNLKMFAAALLPPLVGVLWLLALMSLIGLDLNIANMIAGIVVVGLCIDYGFFMAHGYRSGPAVLKPVRQAVTLSALTTLIGAGVLIFASHPALFSIGLTLTIGVGSGFLAAMLGVIGTCKLLRLEPGDSAPLPTREK